MSDPKNSEVNAIEISTRNVSSTSFEEGMVFQDDRGYVRAVNPAATSILGFSSEQLMGCTSIEPSWQTIHEDGSPFEGETHPAMVALSTGKTCTNVIMGFYRPSGDLVWLKIDSQPLFQDSQTKPYGVVTTFSNITEQKRLQNYPNLNIPDDNIIDSEQVEQALQLSDRRYASIARFAPVAIFCNDKHGNFIYINDRGCEIIGLSLEECLREGWVSGLHPEDRDRVMGEWIETIEKNLPFYSECRFQHDDGTIRSAIAQATAETDEEGEVVGYIGTFTDIGEQQAALRERKQAEESLREANQRIITIWESMTDAYVTLDREWLIIYANQAATNVIKQLINLEPEEFLGRSHWDIFPLSIGQEIEREYRRAVSEQVAVKLEVMYEPTGNWFEIHAYPSAEGLGIYFRDISERKQSEVALSESERKYRTVFDSIDEGFCVCEMLFDENGKASDYRFLEVNPAFEKMTGLEGAMGKRVRELVPNLETSWFDIYGRVVLTGEPIRFENRSIAMNRWFDVNAFRVGEPQNHKFGVLFTNITERKQAEEALRVSEAKLQCFVDSNIVGMIMADLSGNLHEANNAFLHMLDYTQEDFQSGNLCWRDITPPEWFEADERAIARIRETGSCPPFEKEYLSKGGRRVPILIGIAMLPNSREKCFCFVLDLSDRKHFEAEREKLLKGEQAARAEAESANRVKDEFLAILSHELRSPLNPSLVWTQLLKTYKTDPERLDQGLDTIDRNAKLLLELIDDLLDVAKILRGKITLNLAPVNLERAIEGALETVSTAANAKAIAVETYLNPIGQVNGDLARLQQIFWNLLSNAVKFTNNGGKVEVRLDRFGDAAQIIVSDNGKGITPEFLPHVFEYFRQADGSVTRNHGGLGLGLAIVRHLVELHGGVIAVTSSGIDCGASFIVSLPLLPTKSDLNNSDRSQLNLSQNQPDLKGVRILVVDDDPDNLEFLTMTLQCYQASVIAASSAAEALLIFEEFVPDILLSDIAMPDMDGLTFLRSIRSRSPDRGGTIPAIALSAYARDIDRERAITAGFQVHVPKPINISFLAATILDFVRETK
jgi:PAS domain S-box-containing protein